MKPITIVGGGLAGLALGIGLRQRQIPVTIVEAGTYPRHRVCGEFISGRGQETLGRLGLDELLVRSGARTAHTASFSLPNQSCAIQALPYPALCLSRFVFDKLLADRFCELGGSLRCGERYQREYGDGVVRASGRRLHSTEDGWHWFALKAHATKVALRADLEMHLSPNSYVGLCRLGDERVNVCGLFRRRKDEADPRQPWKERLMGPPGSHLRALLSSAEWEEDSFCAVAGLSLKPRKAAPDGECCIGDALTMIAPVTGNGMSLAFESAELALPSVTAYAYGKVSWVEARQKISRASNARFSRRLRSASWLQNGLFNTSVRRVLMPLAGNWPFLWRRLFLLTR